MDAAPNAAAGPEAPLCDAHFHLADLAALQPDAAARLAAEGRLGVASCHDRAGLAATLRLIGDNGLAGRIGVSLGIHPQLPVWDEAAFLEEAALGRGAAAGGLQSVRLAAVGECGFDFWTGRPEAALGLQRDLFRFQADLAARAGLPLVVHLRKATDLAFAEAGRLARLPGVVFHSWPGSPREAASLLARGVDAYFSLGGPLLQGRKAALACLDALPLGRLLLESDAPYQTLKGEAFSSTAALGRVYDFAAARRGLPAAELRAALAANFNAAYAGSFAI